MAMSDDARPDPGPRESLDRLVPLVYEELRLRARQRREN